MQREVTTTEVGDIMLRFADETGLTNPDNPPRRYLWTDAYAVCNYLSLYRHTGDEIYEDLARRLIDQVHEVLGKHRADDPRQGWISGLSEIEGARHPTAGGLRIGKKLNERSCDDAYDERLEWERDGQYFHYLTKWMHALCRTGLVTRQAEYCRWAVELAKATHAGFSKLPLPDGGKRLVWKMSIDLSYPLIASTGLHDPLDGYITYKELGHCAKTIEDNSPLPDLSTEIADLTAMSEGLDWSTDDPLGIGGLLFDACRVFQLIDVARFEVLGLADILIRDLRVSLDSFARQNSLSHTVEYRLAFRELGLSIGLRAVEKMRCIARDRLAVFGERLGRDLDDLRRHDPLVEAIEGFWRRSSNQQARSWLDHQDINNVMLATSLLPDEFLAL